MAESVQHSPCYDFVRNMWIYDNIKTPEELKRLQTNGWITQAEFNEIIVLPKEPDPLLEWMKKNSV